MNVKKLRRLDAAILAILPNPVTQDRRVIELRDARADFMDSLADGLERTKSYRTAAAEIVAQDAIEREPGTTLRVSWKDLEPGEYKVGYRVRIADGRYRGVVGYIHTMDRTQDTVEIRTGDPADWRVWDARR